MRIRCPLASLHFPLSLSPFATSRRPDVFPCDVPTFSPFDLDLRPAPPRPATCDLRSLAFSIPRTFFPSHSLPIPSRSVPIASRLFSTFYTFSFHLPISIPCVPITSRSIALLATPDPPLVRFSTTFLSFIIPFDPPPSPCHRLVIRSLDIILVRSLWFPSFSEPLALYIKAPVFDRPGNHSAAFPLSLFLSLSLF